MWTRLKGFLRWVYDWITVLAGIVAGVPTLLLQFFDMVTGADLAAVYPVDPKTAGQIVAGVAVVKGICAMIESRRNA